MVLQVSAVRFPFLASPSSSSHFEIPPIFSDSFLVLLPGAVNSATKTHRPVACLP
jgi:hypothetical protein